MKQHRPGHRPVTPKGVCDNEHQKTEGNAAEDGHARFAQAIARAEFGHYYWDKEKEAAFVETETRKMKRKKKG